MFSYNKYPSYESNLIQQIQGIGHQIFQKHLTSITNTDNQQMSLQLSSGSDSERQKEVYYTNRKSNDDSQSYSNSNGNSNSYSQLRHSQVNQKRNILPTFYGSRQQKQIDISTNKKQPHFKKSYKNISNEGSYSRMTQSTVLPQHKYTQENNNAMHKSSHSRVTQIQKKMHKKTKAEKQNFDQQFSSMKGHLNLSNALKIKDNNKQVGLSHSALKSRNKSHNRYASNYVSPYAKKSFNNSDYPKSYMQKGNKQINGNKQTKEFKYIKQRINQNVQPQISYRKQKSNQDRMKIKRFSNVSSKYKNERPIFAEYKGYMEEHIYKKMKTQMAYYQERKRQFQSRSPEEVQYKWENFIERQESFLEDKKQKILSKQLQKMHRQTNNLTPNQKSHSTTKRQIPLSGRMTIEDHVKKIKRQKQLLKKTLQQNEISNFMERSYNDQKRFGKQIFDSVFGLGTSSHSPKKKQIQSMLQYSTINDQSRTQKQKLSVSRRRQDLLNASLNLSQKDNKFSKYLPSKFQTQKNRSKDRNSNQKKNFMNLNINSFNVGGMMSPQKSINSKNISELLNPKYFKSIDQLEQYNSVTSRQRQQKGKSYKDENFFQVPKCYEKHKIRHFDPDIMQKTIEDIQKMKGNQKNRPNCQIQDLITKKKVNIQSFNNISNLVPHKQFQSHFIPHENNILDNSRFHKNRFISRQQVNYNNRQSFINRYIQQRSVSRSPIQKQQTISMIHNINNDNDEKYSSPYQCEKRDSSLHKSRNVFKIKNKSEMEQVFGDFIKEGK